MAGEMQCTVLLILVLLNLTMAAKVSKNIGINYGRLGDNLPAPQKSVALIRSLGFQQVKIFDSDPTVLKALSNTGLRVVMAATNEELAALAASPAAAATWVAEHVQPFLPSARIRVITVGNELLSHPEWRRSWPLLFPAMQNLQTALETANLHRQIKLSTCIAMDALNSSFPPSAGIFRPDIADTILRPILNLISSTNSYLFINAYPYLAWSVNSAEIPLDYALLAADGAAISDGPFRYSNLLDAQVDAFVAAMAALGFPDVKVAVGETGWPTAGGLGASVENAAIYNGRLMSKLGTPRRAGVKMPIFIFALFNEDQKPGAETERNWGILYPNASLVYGL
ncbi:hypothetical protein SUGI_0189990 [Cryptomeria japonica]|uniref:glucan endo-1,3-beta-glucosidase 11 n=1 Tax=Cryptomeria japonica TaxID=3369 RepID=UPI002408CF13|nr:glucan endo-1,3-beta-glucosidase 11 [Cryptomeria japonica]GLJ12391.1 hypothetical protein SUGI_0189990 [Cryptomeria japonica]